MVDLLEIIWNETSGGGQNDTAIILLLWELLIIVNYYCENCSTPLKPSHHMKVK